ncbi:MAG: DUF4924 family protein [Bacteroidales bacterium]|jgi:hypothetical protein|nr:DUF4924 family protein [Bacteroidales bacterium]
MIIAEQKRKENIIEYILYIRQVQDIIRMTNYNIDKIDELVISKFSLGEKIRDKIKNWYSDLIIMMKNENCEKEGDFAFISDLIKQLDVLNHELLNEKDSHKHSELYRWAKPNIEEFKKLNGKPNASDTLICIDALHSLLLLRMKKQPVSEETMQAMQTFSNLMANLALHFRERGL